jgi:hypothetical protein
MNRNALKSYAPKARLEFIRAVTDRAAFYGVTKDQIEPATETGNSVIINGRAFPRVVSFQRRALVDHIKEKGFEAVIEAMAYTWFNRFVALRYMELHGYLDHGYRVLSHPAGGALPEILEHAEHLTLTGLDSNKIIEMKLDGGHDADLYRLLLVAQCNALYEAMPFLFEKVADETELLLPDNLLHSDSLIRKLVNEIEEADWQQVEIIGWLYQFYISDKKDEVIGKVVKSEDIPAATQLFTPNWIVKYLVQNTLGRLWLATYPDSPLCQQMEYYIEPAEQTDDVKAQLAAITPKSLDPEKLTLLDDACGSGHILVEAYDLFKAIYQERGYRSKDIPRLIIEKNLFGLEIDDRAAQLAAFVLMMKARADDRRIFDDHIQTNVIAIQESKGLESLLAPEPAVVVDTGELPFTDSDMFPDAQKQLTLGSPKEESPLASVEPCLRDLIKLFEHGKTFGSLIRVPPELTAQLPAARLGIEAMIAKGQLWEHRAAALLLPLLRQAELLAMTYNAVVANPPYLGWRGLNSELKEFAEVFFPDTKSDLFAMFIERGLEFAKGYGLTGLITMHSWMFLAVFKEMREKLLRQRSITVVAHFGPRAFSEISGEIVQTVAFVMRPMHVQGFQPLFFRLVDGDENSKRQALINRSVLFGSLIQEDFGALPGSPLAYWISHNARRVFERSIPLRDIAEATLGMTSSNNDRFIRLWSEVSIVKVGFGCRSHDEAFESGMKWFPYNKGGSFRKWYGNNEFLINWEHRGAEVMNYAAEKYGSATKQIRNIPLFFKPSVTWSFVSSASFGVRKCDAGFIFDVGGSSAFPSSVYSSFVTAFLCSKVAFYFLKAMNPTLNFQAGNVASLPLIRDLLDARLADVTSIADACMEIAKQDWDNFETSWDFSRFPLLAADVARTTGQSWEMWSITCLEHISRLRSLESQSNKMFVDGYGLNGEVETNISGNEITLTRPDREHDMQRLISYAIGCMMGRYSLDKPGLVYAHSRNEGFDPSQYQTFPADADGIIPITELSWFPDDATERLIEFIAKAWPREHLEENLKFIADSLGQNRDEHPRDTIRRYLATGFYKDHLQTYKRRPIYWLFTSGKQRAFQCLVYLHRYHEGTLSRMRTEYVIPLQGYLSHRIEQLDGDIPAATSTAHRRKLEKEREALIKQRTEVAAFDEKLRHYADRKINLDLDDGVKVNYGKFGDLLAEVKAVTGGTEE